MSPILIGLCFQELSVAQVEPFGDVYLENLTTSVIQQQQHQHPDDAETSRITRQLNEGFYLFTLKLSFISIFSN